MFKTVNELFAKQKRDPEASRPETEEPRELRARIEALQSEVARLRNGTAVPKLEEQISLLRAELQQAAEEHARLREQLSAWQTDTKTERARIDALIEVAAVNGLTHVIVFTDGPCKGMRVMIPSEADLVLGRGRRADVEVEDDEVSRMHCRLRVDHRGHGEVMDLGSANGTKVGARRINARRETDVPPGSEVTIGESSFRIDPLEEAVTLNRYAVTFRGPSSKADHAPLGAASPAPTTIQPAVRNDGTAPRDEER